jgi:transcriptional regulator with XRE-family HTH domain
VEPGDKAAILRRFGGAVRAWRRQAGLSQEELADRAGLDRTYVGGIERGERNVAVVNIVRLARALGIVPGLLFDPGDAFSTHSEGDER